MIILPKIRSRKTKDISIKLVEINGLFVVNTTHIIVDYIKGKEFVYINSYFKYKKYKIHLNRNFDRKDSDLNNSEYKNKKDNDKKNKIRKLMLKDRNITMIELSKLTGFSMYMVNRFYMGIRRDICGDENVKTKN